MSEMRGLEKKENIINRRLATPEDTDLAKKIHHAAYRDVVLKQFGAWNEEVQDSFFEGEWNEGKNFEIIACDNIDCGYFLAEESEDVISIKELAVMPEFQGRGVGTSILSEFIQKARANGKTINIAALKENKALELYRRLGFKDSGSTETHTELTIEPKQS